jgi:dedicator of cytokinesis protein 3
VCASRRPLINWSTDPSSSKAPLKTDESQVFIGIFPESHIYVRDELADAEGRLAEVASHLNGSTTGPYTSGGTESTKVEEDPDALSTARKSFKVGPRPDQANSSRAALPVYPASLRSSSPAESQVSKPLPPRPSLKSGDETASGAVQPIIDEIASALREWHALMFQYLARRDYGLFHLVREHIEALHLGRRQLLVQTLSSEETVNLRRECVVRLVGGNVVQGLDIIVRHPTWGALVTTDVEGEVDPRSWVSPVRMYAMQTALAYMDPMSSPGVSKASLGPVVDLSSSFGPIPTPALSAFPEFLRTRGIPRGCGSFSLPAPVPSGKARFYHVFLDVRAFVASPCSPGETAELFFSLYNKNDQRFLTEEFSAYLNHNGVLARDPAARIRSMFTDLVQSDVQEPIYLVCRIVRNGALKIGNNMSSSGVIDGRRGSDVSFKERENSTNGGWDPSSSSLALATPLTVLSNRSQVFDNSANFRRPFGCAILELSQLSQIAQDQNDISSTREHTMPIYVPTNETIFSMLHQDIIMNNTKEFEKSPRYVCFSLSYHDLVTKRTPRAEMIAVSIKVFRGDAETIVRENTTLLQDSSITRRLSFPDVVFPGDTRNDMYIKLWSGEFTSSNVGHTRRSVANFARGQVGSSHTNIQVTMEVRDHEGKSVEPILSPGSGEPLTSQFNSLVFQRNTLPTYGELVKLSLPLTGITKLHVFFTFRHRTSREKVGRSANDHPDRPFAFAFLPLFPDGRAALEDGSHTLILYRADRLTQITPDVYLSATPCLTLGQKLDQIIVPPDMQRHAPIMKDSMTIRSSLCSTKYTQNPVLLNLLYWEQITDTSILSTVLSKFTFVGEVEIVKFLSDIFDALFGILVSSNNQSGEMDLLVFNALVTVLGIVQDRRFNNFQPVLDVYIERHFDCASASSHIIHSMSRLLANPTATETASSLRAALKVWDYIFKFIARSRELQKVKEMGIAGGATAEHLESTFRREMRSHLSEINRMMSSSTPPSIIGTQTIAIQHFTSILPELDKIFPITELVSHVRAFANAIVTGKGKIVIWKLIMFLQVVRGFLFDNPQSRTLLLEAVVVWIKPHFGRFDEYVHTQPGDPDNVKDVARVSWMENIRLCVTIIAVMLDKLCHSLVQPSVQADRTLLRKEQDNVDYLLSLLPR